MKKLLSAISIALISLTSPAYAQIGGLINKVKLIKNTDIKKPAPEVATIKFSDIPAGMENAEYEEQAVKLVTDKATRERWAEKYTKAKIVSTDWQMERDQYSNYIICRKIYMKLYGVWPDGKCKAVDFGFRQDYMGGSDYTKSLIYNSIGGMELIICD